jgi:hypothetical protein
LRVRLVKNSMSRPEVAWLGLVGGEVPWFEPVLDVVVAAKVVAVEVSVTVPKTLVVGPDAVTPAERAASAPLTNPFR